MLCCFTLSGQNFSKSYFDFFKDSWEREITEEMKARIDPALDEFYKKTSGMGFWEKNAELRKKGVLEQIENYKTVLELKGLNIDTLNAFTIVKEKGSGLNLLPTNGYIIIPNKISFTFTKKKSKYLLSTNYFDSTEVYYPYRKKIKDLLESNNIKQLSDFAKQEVIDKVLKANIEYEIVLYNRSNKTPLQIIYLHDGLWK